MSLFRTVQEDVLQRLGRVGLAARQAVESALVGQHRSVRRGLSIEFAGHRPYQPGDDLRHLDWSVYARSDRFDIRQFEEETRLRATLVVDVSGSMGFASSGGSKADYARQLSAALAFVMVRQADAVGLALVDHTVRFHTPAASTTAHLAQVLQALESAHIGGETALGPVLELLAMRVHRRGVVVIITDGFDDSESILRALRLMRHRRQDVRVFQIIDPAELTMPMNGTVAFDSLENEGRVIVDADRIRGYYQRAFQAHQLALAEGCHAMGATFDVFHTNEDLALALGRTLAGTGRAR